MNLFPINLQAVLGRIDRDGAGACPLLRKADRLHLRAEADRLPFARQPETVGKGLVRQELSVHEPLTSTPFVELRDALQAMLDDAVRRIAPDLFMTPLALDTLVLQRYKPGSVGITPHRDGPSRINLVVVVVLEGEARFAVCDDRARTNPRDVRAPPGHVILMRAPALPRLRLPALPLHRGRPRSTHHRRPPPAPPLSAELPVSPAFLTMKKPTGQVGEDAAAARVRT